MKKLLVLLLIFVLSFSVMRTQLSRTMKTHLLSVKMKMPAMMKKVAQQKKMVKMRTWEGWMLKIFT